MAPLIRKIISCFIIKGELRRKMNLWSNYTLLSSQPLSEICLVFMIAECK